MTTSFYRTRISGTGSYLPEKVLTNADIEKMVETSDAWIVERTGIRERHIAAADQVTSDLGLIAAQRAIKAAGLTAQDIDMIIFATVTPDTLMPSTACVLQKKLGARQVFSFDLSAACSGFIYGLTVADQFIKTGFYKHILIVGAEVLSRFIDYQDRETCILFGDGAGAMIVSRAEDKQDSRIFSAHPHADGGLSDLLVLPAGGSAMPVSQAALDSRGQYVKMKGREIFKNAVRAMVQCSQEALQSSGMTMSDISWVVPHQANVRIIESVASYLDLPMERVIMNLGHMGNTSAATIPVAFDEAVRDGRVLRGQNILFTAFGAGLTSGSLLFRY
jgi:3-oxoacyl-[acyl-carrier-protein] synthase-3